MRLPPSFGEGPIGAVGRAAKRPSVAARVGAPGGVGDAAVGRRRGSSLSSRRRRRRDGGACASGCGRASGVFGFRRAEARGGAGEWPIGRKGAGASNGWVERGRRRGADATGELTLVPAPGPPERWPQTPCAGRMGVGATAAIFFAVFGELVLDASASERSDGWRVKCLCIAAAPRAVRDGPTAAHV